MKKLANTTWGAIASTLKRLYTGRVRPVLEYGMAAWGLEQRYRDILEQDPQRFPSALRSLPEAKKDISLSKAAYQE